MHFRRTVNNNKNNNNTYGKKHNTYGKLPWCVEPSLAVAGICVLLPLPDRFVPGGWNGIGVFQTLGTCLVEMLAVNPCAPFVSPFLNHCGLLVSIGVNKCRYYLLLVSIICYSCRLVSLLFANRHAFSARQVPRVNADNSVPLPWNGPLLPELRENWSVPW